MRYIMKCAKCNCPAVSQTFRVMFSIVRHGSTEMNESHKIIGSIENFLSDTGKQQAKETALWLQKNRNYTCIVSSPMIRAAETAKIIGGVLGISVEYDPRLKERCVGEYEGTPEFPGMLAVFLGRELSPPAESLDTFRERVHAALAEIASSRGQTLVVTHALPMLTMVSNIKSFGMPDILRYEVPANCVPVDFFVGENCSKCGNRYYEEVKENDRDCQELERLLRMVVEEDNGFWPSQESFNLVNGACCLPYVEAILVRPSDGAWLMKHRHDEWDGWHIPGTNLKRHQTLEGCFLKALEKDGAPNIRVENLRFVHAHKWLPGEHPLGWHPLSLVYAADLIEGEVTESDILQWTTEVIPTDITHHEEFQCIYLRWRERQ